MPHPWRPRASQLGPYLACPWRAACDRAVAEGRATRDQLRWHEDKTGFAPHGSVIHWVTQVGIGCVFLPREPEGPDELREASEHWAGNQQAAAEACRRGDPLYYKPPAAEYILARSLFRGSVDAHNAAVAASSQLLASRIAPARDGRPWIAESSWATEYVTGHMDLLSQDHRELKDIKTTAKPPDVADVVCKYEYFAQMVIYAHIEPRIEVGTIEYVDSLRGNWAYRVPINFKDPAVVEYGNQLEAYCRFLMSDALWAVAWPNLGPHCDKTWCPYRDGCKRRILPAPGTGNWFHAQTAFRPSGIVKIPGGMDP